MYKEIFITSYHSTVPHLLTNNSLTQYANISLLRTVPWPHTIYIPTIPLLHVLVSFLTKCLCKPREFVSLCNVFVSTDHDVLKSMLCTVSKLVMPMQEFYLHTCGTAFYSPAQHDLSIFRAFQLYSRFPNPNRVRNLLQR